MGHRGVFLPNFTTPHQPFYTPHHPAHILVHRGVFYQTSPLLIHLSIQLNSFLLCEFRNFPQVSSTFYDTQPFSYTPSSSFYSLLLSSFVKFQYFLFIYSFLILNSSLPFLILNSYLLLNSTPHSSVTQLLPSLQLLPTPLLINSSLLHSSTHQLPPSPQLLPTPQLLNSSTSQLIPTPQLVNRLRGVGGGRRISSLNSLYIARPLSL